MADLDAAASNNLLAEQKPENSVTEAEEDFAFPFSDCAFVTTSLNLASSTPLTVETVLDHLLLLAPSQPDPKFLDMGCGDGRFVFSAARRGLHAVGIDLEPSNIELCRELAKQNGLEDKCQFFLADIFTFDISEFNLITCYLYQKTLQQLSSKLGERLKQGDCLIATLLYTPRNWTPIFVDDVYKIYLYDSTFDLNSNSG